MSPDTRSRSSSIGNKADMPTDWDKLMDTLSEDSQTLVKILTKILTDKFTEEIKGLKDCLSDKDKEITRLNKENKLLKTSIQDLELRMDELEQYSRRDCVVITGRELPPEEENEKTTELVMKTAQEKLGVTITRQDISIAHRLGKPRKQQAQPNTSSTDNSTIRPRPIIVKLVRRSLKYDLVHACVTRKPNLSVNESLTPRRMTLMRSILAVRKVHKQKFKQCYSNEGKIFILLHGSTQKFCITSQETLLEFLNRYPTMRTRTRNSWLIKRPSPIHTLSRINDLRLAGESN